MSKRYHVVGVDCGASGGKMVSAYFDGERLTENEYIPFPNRSVRVLDSLYHDFFSLYNHSLDGLARIVSQYGAPDTIGFDTHGSAHAYIDGYGRIVFPPYHPNDNSTLHTLEELFAKIPEQETFRLTGCLCNRGYMLPQVFSRAAAHDPCMDYADKLIMFPDLFGYFYTGVKGTAEATIAGTTGLFDYRQERWSTELCEALGIPTRLFLPPKAPGWVLGPVHPAVEDQTGAVGMKVVSVAGHDSASAVAAIPGFGKNKLYVCLGTNANMGVETDRPDISDAAYRYGFKNSLQGEPGAFLVYQDFPAFLLVNAVKKEWAQQGNTYSYDQVEQMAEEARSVHSYVNLKDPRFLKAHGSIIEALTEHLAETGQTVPATHGEWIRCLFESIAMWIKQKALHVMEKLNIPLEEIVVVNGGAWYPQLVQMISDASHLPTRSGMPYATLIGNLLWQLRGLNVVSSMEEMRDLAARSFRMNSFEPRKSYDWDGDYSKGIQMGLYAE